MLLRAKLSLCAGLFMALQASTCSPDQTNAVALTGCTAWNQAELQLAPKVAQMSDAENGTLLGFKALLSGTKATPGLCRTAIPPTAADAVNASITTAVAQLTPLLAKYITQK